MNEGKSYFPGWVLNEAANGGVVVEVQESKSDKWKKGDYAVGMLSWKLFQVLDEKAALGIHLTPEALRPMASQLLGACGMPGLSALLPIEHIADPKPGEVAFVSGAAGAVGSIAGQILKLKGLTVYGSAGTDEKVKWLKEIGFDGAFNYNTSSLDKELSQVAPEGINVYFDNVGGPTLETVLNHMKKNGRIIMCGSISNYNTASWESAYGVRNLFNMTTKSLKMQGFIITDYSSEFKDASTRLVGWVIEGKLKVHETIIDGFDNIPKAFVGLFSGANQGKMVIRA